VTPDALVRRAQRGDPIAMEELVRKVMPVIAPVCGAVALESADDALQETLIVVLRQLRALREPAALNSWARRIAAREAVRVARKRAPVVDGCTLEATAPPVTLADLDTAIDVQSVLATLTPEQRAVLVLRDLEGRSESDVALLLDVPEGTVKSRLHRARAAFARRWQR
jgi:RNA polymerase sigma factor (sigma-70 family)